MSLLHPSKENYYMDPIIVALFSSFMMFIADKGKYLFQATGDPSWNYSSLLPYFNEMEETLGLAKPHTSDIAQDYLSMAQRSHSLPKKNAMVFSLFNLHNL